MHAFIHSSSEVVYCTDLCTELQRLVAEGVQAVVLVVRRQLVEQIQRARHALVDSEARLAEFALVSGGNATGDVRTGSIVDFGTLEHLIAVQCVSQLKQSRSESRPYRVGGGQ
jgi:hypothetical protein